MFKTLRIVFLLLIFATVAQTAWQARSRATAWQDTLYVGIYPIAADGAATTRSHVAALQADSFSAIDTFFDAEAKRHHLAVLQPVRTLVAPPLAEQPPSPPRNGSALDAVLWSLRMRWWAWRHDRIAGPKPAVRLFVLFHDPAKNARLDHSTGIERGMIGIINAFASPEMAGSNAVIIAHELLHTLGATDKYAPGNNLPLFPDGYAEPERTPRYPQAFAEIMGGRIPVSATQAEIPASLDLVRIGSRTAEEIRWRAP